MKIALPLLLVAVASATIAAPPLPTPFQGKIGPTIRESKPDWPDFPQAPAGAPNIVVVLLDDVGFGATHTFGGPARTPNLDRLAEEGLRYNRFHVTGLCSPTRSALLSGRNHHRVGFGTVAEGAVGFPGYDSVWRPDTVSFPQILRRNGYSTAAFGKWHNTPYWELGPDGPFDRWPTSLGFDYFYGHQLGETSLWEPVLFRNTTAIDPDRTPQEGYHFTTAIADEAINWVQTQQAVTANRPFLLYFAPLAIHASLHVPQKWIDKQKGRFDQGWDRLREETFARQKELGIIPADTVLTPRPAEIPAWDSFTADQKRLLTRQIEVLAGFLEHTDYEVGRVLDAVRALPNGENTLIIFIVSDNGPSAEGGIDGTSEISSFFGVPPLGFEGQLAIIDQLGGPLVDNHYSSGWAWGLNAPLQWTKQVASHLGGTRAPLVVSWPAKIKDKGGLRTQFTHINGVAATILEAVGIPFPAEVDGVRQEPLDGKSFYATFTNAAAPSPVTRQYFEMVGNRGIYLDGWWAGAQHSIPWDRRARGDSYEDDKWELYHLDEDFSQGRDLASANPDKLKELQAAWEEEARANDVYPLAGFPSIEDGVDLTRPSLFGAAPAAKQTYVYHGPTPRIANASAPLLAGSHRITARVEIPRAGAEGVIVAQGERHGGYTLFIKDGRLVYEYNFYGRIRDRLATTEPLPAGPLEIVYTFTRDKSKDPWVGGVGRLEVNGKVVAEGRISRSGFASYFGAFGVGRQWVAPVSRDYEVPFAFSGHIDEVRIELLPPS